ncbi:hypothetical protein T5B8_07098 [Salinisphaera sp. T5B8]
MARVQASRYKKGEANWLIVPIHLGGRPFMALDDVVAADLTNRFRFLMYYDAFTELVKMDAIVPALDGFEEVFLETGSGEAVSALGNLINRLHGSGRVLIAARRAYFEVRSFASQARMFDSIGEDAGAVFARVALRRWDKDRFLAYASKAGVPDERELYDLVERRLGADHPLLTRAVLVKKLVIEAKEGEPNSLVGRLGTKPEDYFYEFVGAIIEREAHAKWIDRSARDTAASPLLSIQEHHGLLASVALEMWNTQSHALRYDYLDMLADLFCTEHKKDASTTRQVKERLHQHSLLTTAEGSARKLTFDHEDFREFYLGEAMGREIEGSGITSLSTLLGVAMLPERTCDAAVAFLKRKEKDYLKYVDKLSEIGKSSLTTSFEKENAGALAIRILDGLQLDSYSISGNAFPNGVMANRKLKGINFFECSFNSQDFTGARISSCVFHSCDFVRLDIPSTKVAYDSSMQDCRVDAVFEPDSDATFFSPGDIRGKVEKIGFSFSNVLDKGQSCPEDVEPDERVEIAIQALRAFMRATHLNQSVFKLRLGQAYGFFESSVLPALIKQGVVREIDYRGSGVQRRYKLTIPMKNIEPAIKHGDDWDEFIRVLNNGE